MTSQGTQSSAPTRTCVACRERRPASRLVRFVALSGQVVPDLRRAVAGRGAHLCASTACLAKAAKRQSFRRAFRGPVRVELGDLRDTLHRAFAAEAKRVASTPRISLLNQARAAWIQQGLREFTLDNPGAMNRGPTNRGAISGPEDGAERRTENR